MNTDMFLQALIDLHDTGVLYEKTEEKEHMSSNCPECYMRDGAHKMDCSVGRTHMSGDHNKYYKRNLKDEIEEGLDALPLITVTEIKENEDGSATAIIDTSVEGTRLLVELGLISLLEKAIDKENTEYTIKDGLHE